MNRPATTGTDAWKQGYYTAILSLYEDVLLRIPVSYTHYQALKYWEGVRDCYDARYKREFLKLPALTKDQWISNFERDNG
jgi:hypothetical protein